ncbi:hypothetical protein N665_2199s0003 [Sinapis alba]|nr:hypothetical protein N665_2199s0003 [Sinapis alba]
MFTEIVVALSVIYVSFRSISSRTTVKKFAPPRLLRYCNSIHHTGTRTLFTKPALQLRSPHCHCMSVHRTATVTLLTPPSLQLCSPLQPQLFSPPPPQLLASPPLQLINH